MLGHETHHFIRGWRSQVSCGVVACCRDLSTGPTVPASAFEPAAFFVCIVCLGLSSFLPRGAEHRRAVSKTMASACATRAHPPASCPDAPPRTVSSARPRRCPGRPRRGRRCRRPGCAAGSVRLGLQRARSPRRGYEVALAEICCASGFHLPVQSTGYECEAHVDSGACGRCLSRL